ncbi:hypothetical protein D3C79_878170 [compost metagenome]
MLTAAIEFNGCVLYLLEKNLLCSGIRYNLRWGHTRQRSQLNLQLLLLIIQFDEAKLATRYFSIRHAGIHSCPDTTFDQRKYRLTYFLVTGYAARLNADQVMQL